MLDLDRLGMNFDVKHKGSGFKLRLPFPKPAEDRKGIKVRNLLNSSLSHLNSSVTVPRSVSGGDRRNDQGSSRS